MDDLADEDHTQHWTPEEIDDYRINWWIHSNKIGSETMPIRHRSDFKQALSILRRLKDKEDEAQRKQRWAQRVLLRLGGVGKEHGGLFIRTKVTMEMSQVLIEQGNLLYK